jgi:hypothetical protein
MFPECSLIFCVDPEVLVAVVTELQGSGSAKGARDYLDSLA